MSAANVERMNQTERFAHHLIGTSVGKDDYERRHHYREAVSLLRVLPDSQVLRGRALWKEFHATSHHNKPKRLTKLWWSE